MLIFFLQHLVQLFITIQPRFSSFIIRGRGEENEHLSVPPTHELNYIICGPFPPTAVSATSFLLQLTLLCPSPVFPHFHSYFLHPLIISDTSMQQAGFLRESWFLVLKNGKKETQKMNSISIFLKLNKERFIYTQIKVCFINCAVKLSKQFEQLLYHLKYSVRFNLYLTLTIPVQFWHIL